MFRRIKTFYWRNIAHPIKYARHIGVTIGKNCLIDTKGWSTEPYLIFVGDNVQITRGVSIHTHGGSHVARKSNPDFDCFGKVVIEDDAYIGACSQIMPGVTIGRGALVAAGSIVTKSVPQYTVVAGNPARIICSVDEYINKNSEFNVNTYRMSPESKKAFLMSLPSDRFIRK